MDADGRGWTRMDADGRGWTRMDADGRKHMSASALIGVHLRINHHGDLRGHL
jgi:hypothetical protein